MSRASTKYFKRSSKERREYIDIIRCFNKFMKFIDQVDFSGRNQHHARERQNAVDKLNGLRKVKAVISNKRGALLEGRAILASQDMIIEMYQWLEIDFIIYKNGSIAVAVHHSYADYNVAKQTRKSLLRKLK